MRRVILLAMAGLSACFAGEVPEGIQLSCESDAECPGEFRCALEVSRCVSPAALAADAPTLVEAQIADELLKSGDEVEVSFVVDQALAILPVVSVGELQLEVTPGEGTSAFVARGIIGTSAPDEGPREVLAGVLSAAGRPAELRLGSVVVDRTANRLETPVDVELVAQSGAVVSLGLQLREVVELEDAPRVEVLNFEGATVASFEVSVLADDGFVFAYTVDIDEGDYVLEATLFDSAGNASAPLDLGTLVVDDRAPSFSEVSAELIPAASNPGVALGLVPSAIADGSTLRVRFRTDEDVLLPDVTLSCASDTPLARVADEIGARFFTFEALFDGDVDEGTCTPRLRALDLAGNEALLDLEAIAIDVTPPANLVDAEGLGAHLARAPWGAADLDGDGEDDLGTRVIVEGGERAITVVALDPATGAVLASGPSDVALDLGALDRVDVDVVAVDAGGNTSATTRLTRGLWVATLGGKIPGSLVENPHTARSYRALPVELEDARALELGASLGSAQTTLAWTAGPREGVANLSRGYAAVAWDDARGRAIAFGGDFENSETDTTLAWDGERWTELFLAERPPRRNTAAMVYDSARDRMVLFGGKGLNGVALDDTWVFDGARWTQLAPPAAPPARRFAQAAYDPVLDQVVLFGGADDQLNHMDDTWVFDGETWTEVNAPGPRARASAAMTYDPVRGGVVLAGGFQLDNYDTSLWRWDGTAWVEEPMSGNMPFGIASGFHEHRMTFDPARGAPLIIGANALSFIQSGAAVVGDGAYETLASAFPVDPAFAWFTDPVRGELVWASEVSPTRVLREGEVAPLVLGQDLPRAERVGGAFDKDTGAVLLFGGRDETGDRLERTFRFDGRARLLDEGAPFLSPAIDDMAAFTLNGDAYFFGGNNGSATNDVQRFTGSDWVSVNDIGAPSARSESAAVLDEGSGRVVVFGGRFQSTALAGTFEFDGSAWTTLPIGRLGPDARFGHQMAYDRVRNAVILYGGDTNDADVGGGFDDTWRFSGGTWTDISDEVGRLPGPRAFHAMATDPHTGRVVLFAGESLNSFEDNRLFTLEEDGWRELDLPFPPPATSRFALVEDPNRSALVCFGGVNEDQPFVLDRARGGHPALAAYFHLAFIGAGTTALDVDVRARAGGSGGVNLSVWREGEWQTAATSAAATPELISSGPLVDAFVGQKSVNVALSSVLANVDDGEVAAIVEHLEVRVRYSK